MAEKITEKRLAEWAGRKLKFYSDNERSKNGDGEIGTLKLADGIFYKCLAEPSRLESGECIGIPMYTGIKVTSKYQTFKRYIVELKPL